MWSKSTLSSLNLQFQITIIKLQQEGIMESGSINDYPSPAYKHFCARSNGLRMF